jgi:uncharacterized protein
MTAKVYHADPTARAGRSWLDKLSDLFDRAGGGDIFRPGDRVAVKVHFGERGNTGYLRPAFARRLVGKLRELGAEPFLTDSNTLYRGGRHRTAAHLETARRHGFREEEIGAPIKICDRFVREEGLLIGGRPVRIAETVRSADSLLVITHATGHVIFGYGGAIKNVSMGLASPAGKQVMHSDLKPKVKREKCVGCGTCLRYCPVSAIAIDREGKAVIDREKCVGCGECVAVCPEGAIPPLWKAAPAALAEKTAAYARAVLRGKEDRALFINFLFNITPDCDCCDWSEPPFVPDQGILASRDILSVDQASVDLIRRAPLIPGCTATAKRVRVSEKRVTEKIAGQYCCLPRLPDKFRTLFGVDLEPFLAAAARAGLGARDYRLVKVN